MDKENIYGAFLNQQPLPKGEFYVARAAKPLLFDRNLLDELDKNPEVDRQESKDFFEYRADRNSGGMNVDYHTTDLTIAAAELNKTDTLIMPYLVEMQSRKPLLTQDFRQFAGYTENEFTYIERHGWEGRLKNKVKVLHIPSTVSPVVETILVQRVVLDAYNGITGDMSYGTIILQDNQLARDLGLPSTDDDPAFLNFTPDRVIADTYGDSVLGELTYTQLEKVGIKAHFTDTDQVATLALAAGDLSFKLWVAKTVKPNFPTLLFDEKEEWITASGIFVGAIPLDRLS